MFPASVAFQPGFQPEKHLTPEQYECYQGRLKAMRPRYPWSATLLPAFKAFMVHRSVNVPGKVAYFASITNMMTNRLTRTSPEMFLQRTLCVAPEQIRSAWAVEVMGQVLPKVLFAENTDPNLWEEVYETGPHSCMAGSSLVRQYAHPENHLALAYIEKDARITHRTIVNKETMTYVRIYNNDPDNTPYFVAALNALGYKQSWDTLKNEKIYAEWGECCQCGGDVLRGPYVDGEFNRLRLLNRSEGILTDRNGDIPNYSSDDCDLYCGCEENDCDEENYDDE